MRTDEEIFREIDGMAVGEQGSMILSVTGCHPSLCVRTENFGVVSSDVFVGSADKVTFKRNGRTFRGKMRAVVTQFRFRRIR